MSDRIVCLLSYSHYSRWHSIDSMITVSCVLCAKRGRCYFISGGRDRCPHFRPYLSLLTSPGNSQRLVSCVRNQHWYGTLDKVQLSIESIPIGIGSYNTLRELEGEVNLSMLIIYDVIDWYKHPAGKGRVELALCCIEIWREEWRARSI